MRHIAGKTAVVTGASSGIGAAVARALGEAGAKLVLAARRRERLDALVAEIEAAGGVAQACPTDVTDEAQVEALFEGARSRFGRVDILVNNAGIADHTPTDQLTLARFREVMDANLTSAFLCARAAFRIMKVQGGGGRMLHVGSLSSQVPRPDTIAYASSKFGLRGLNHSLMIDGRPLGISSAVYHPGVVATELVPGMDKDEPSVMSAEDAARIVTLMLDMPPHVSFTEATALPYGMPFFGRG